MLSNQKILITGITGFLGSHIAENLIQENFIVIGLKRKNADCWRCKEFSDNIIWVDIDDDFEDQIIKLNPDIFIHCAWSGAQADSRDLEDLQLENLSFLKKILAIVSKCNSPRFIGLGSQAEYGFLDEAAIETQGPKPHNLYGSVKVEASKIVQECCDQNEIKWYWLRLFSFYGPKESTQWLIPHVITSILEEKSHIDLGPCSQKYAYLFVKDLAHYMTLLIQKKDCPSGIYNISGDEIYELKELLLKLKGCFKNSNTTLKFDVLPTRANQSTIIKGSMRKFHTQIGSIKQTSLETGLTETINYYKSN